MDTDENFLYGTPTEEVDEPLDTANVDSDLEAKRIEDKDKERKEKRYFSAYK